MEKKEIMWTKDELNAIKRNVLTKANLALDENNNIVVSNLSYEYEVQKLKKKMTCYSFDKEIKTLIYYQDRDEIAKILKLASSVSFNPNDADHLGLISTLSKIDPSDHTQIFNILKEIASQFEKIARRTAMGIRSYADTTDEFKTEIAKFKESQDMTFEEMIARSKINIILNSTNGVAQHEIFRELIERYYANLKSLIIINLELILVKEIRANAKKEKHDLYQYHKNFGERFLKKLKKDNARYFGKE